MRVAQDRGQSGTPSQGRKKQQAGTARGGAGAEFI